MADYAILQEVDKCTKCRGCQVACQKVQNLTTIVGNGDKVQADDPVVVKNQRPNDSPPFVRYSCWHCVGAPCIPACPLGAMVLDSNTGAVYVNKTTCNPNACSRQCVSQCRRGGYPKVGTDAVEGFHAYKCNMCYSRINAGKDPACVETCPNKALKFDTKANILAYISTEFPIYSVGDGHVFWGSKKAPGFDPPTTDPFIEDHISPMFSRVLSNPAGKLLVIPAAVFGGLYALYRRKVELATEVEKV